MTGRPSVVAGAAAVVIGAAAGGVSARIHFERVDDHRALCASCHHGQVAGQVLGEAPHSVAFDAECHTCHVLPVREYVVFMAASFGTETPEWASGLEDPVIGGQTCLECHLARGRGAVDCGTCHPAGTRVVDLSSNCEGCHAELTPRHPHRDQYCRDCHVETYLDPDERLHLLMQVSKLPDARSTPFVVTKKP